MWAKLANFSICRLKDTPIAPSAMIANGLATSIYVAGSEYAAKMLAAYPRAKAVITTTDGAWPASSTV
mgnify:CR=1 FL=1